MPLTRETFLNAKGEIYLSQSEIRKLTDKYDIEDIIKILGEIVDEIPFPYSEYTEQEIKDDFNALKNTHLEIIKGEWQSHRMDESILRLYQNEHIRLPKTKNTGGKVSNQFTEEYRLSTPHARYKSHVDLWYAKRKYWLKYFFNPKMHNSYLSQKTLKQGLSGQYSCSQFKPLIAKSMYDTFGAKRVLDLSMGWGDRLVGFLASKSQSYVGIDPSTKLHDPYRKIIDSVGSDKKVTTICSPAEDFDFSSVNYDFVFTSPPYFDLERYSDEDTQSWKRYRDFDDWLNNFLLKTLTKCWESLSVDGRMIINISDIYSQGKTKEICMPMTKHMERLGANYEGVIGYEMSHRTSSSVGRSDLPFCEPMFVWAKGENAQEPNWNPNLFFTF
jgi:hypothetical protein